MKACVNFPASTRGKLVDELRNFAVRDSVEMMNPFSHLIPMKNGMIYDVFTGDTCEIQPSHYVTSILNAELTDDEADVALISDWFVETSTGNVQKASFLKLISGYMFTFLVHDRRFYVFKGSGKNGKGIHKQFLVNILSGAFNTAIRWKALNQGFWEKKANANTGAEAASPEAFGMANCSMLYTDDIEKIQVDAGKLKRTVAGEPMSGRPLYGKPVVISPRGKVCWTTNHEVLLPGDDNAVWERYCLISYNTKYVDRQELVCPAEFRFQQNNVRVSHLLSKLDAFFTVAVRALTSYYRSLEYDANTGVPSLLSSFPVPVEMMHAKADARAEQLPLANFVKNHTTASDQPLSWPLITELFEMYLHFLDDSNERRVRAETTQMSFVRQLLTSLEIKCTAMHVTMLKVVDKPRVQKRRNGSVLIFFLF